MGTFFFGDSDECIKNVFVVATLSDRQTPIALKTNVPTNQNSEQSKGKERSLQKKKKTEGDLHSDQ